MNSPNRFEVPHGNARHEWRFPANAGEGVVNGLDRVGNITGPGKFDDWPRTEQVNRENNREPRNVVHRSSATVALRAGAIRTSGLWGASAHV